MRCRDVVVQRMVFLLKQFLTIFLPCFLMPEQESMNLSLN